ncbi:MAG TPA: UDP-N-acetylmuramate dehydrogenase [Thermoanaerobaculia bacterium]|nr:UDP-N-acetylmuramate dehydrogenase [Thermoanaerobaculia bacterium]
MIPAELGGLRLTLKESVPLAERTTLRIGGPARYFAEVDDAEALAALLRWSRAEGLAVLPLGKGSNVLVPDDGFPGVALVLAGDFLRVRIDGADVAAGGGASLMQLAVETKRAGLSGFENLSGIPSSIGGAIRINAGSYGTEIFELLVTVELVSRAGERRVVPAGEIAHGYRWTALVETDDVIAGGSFRLTPKSREAIEARFREVTEKRKGALPKQANAGSIFKNPPGEYAGKLLEACGMKGRRAGNAQVSDVHANVIVNLGGARAADVLALMEEMKAAVAARFGVALEPEIELLGSAARRAGAPAP